MEQDSSRRGPCRPTARVFFGKFHHQLYNAARRHLADDFLGTYPGDSIP